MRALPRNGCGEIVSGEEVTDHVGTVAGDDDEFVDACGEHGINGALEKRTLSHFEKTLRTFVRERSEPLGHSGRKNYSNHILLFTVYSLRFTVDYSDGSERLARLSSVNCKPSTVNE